MISFVLIKSSWWVG